ncbi:MAG: B12-binding domain-containing radical SAM protein [Verrucomicrobiae bacterium]|nr:B12-binding domain-containing radical SAM protein [Verrucomicrobiae bacterium]
MSEIILATLNAKYQHAAIGLRYLRANLGELRDLSRIVEADINQRPLDVAEQLLSHNPKIIGLGVYIWNATQSTELAAILKKLNPKVVLVLGGPEISYEIEAQQISNYADYIITGEADVEFANLCRRILSGNPPRGKILNPEPPDLASLALPYEEYTDADLANRWLYVETSRGCPFRCEFCLSSLRPGIRRFPLHKVLLQLHRLLERGGRRFKFVDRSFNLDVASACTVLDFFLERLKPNLFLHFEMVPDHLTEPLRDRLRRFPKETLHIELGIQTFNTTVAERIHRHQKPYLTEENLLFLRHHTAATIHADLIIGLPGEDLTSIAAGFNRLLSLQPHEIQVGILKRLRGTTIDRHATEWGMIFSPLPPYEILQTNQIDFLTMQRLRRFAHFWEVMGNSGNFSDTLPLLWSPDKSPFTEFLALSDWLYSIEGRRHGIALDRLVRLLFDYLTKIQKHPPNLVAQRLARDYLRPGRREPPQFLKQHLRNHPTTS